MNVLEATKTTNPLGNDADVAKFIIDDISTPFTLHSVAVIDQQYTLQFWVRSETAGRLIVCNKTITTNTEWQQHVITFKANDVDVEFLFATAGTYYIHQSQLEKGTIATDWTPAPEDVGAAVSTLTQTASGISVSLKTVETTATNALNRTVQYGTCVTAAGTAAKVVILSTFTLYTGATVQVKFTNANTVANPTLNVNSTGAKAIRAYGAALTADSVHNWTAGSIVTFVYDGTYWNISSSNDAAKTATNFMSYDSTNGLLIGNKSSGSWSGNRAQVTSSAFNVLDSSGTQLASFGTTATIGKTSGTLNNVYIDSDSVDIRKGTTVMSRFSANQIDLGMDNKSTVINLCGGNGSIKSTEASSSWQRMTIESAGSLDLKTSGEIKLDALSGSTSSNYRRAYLDLTAELPWLSSPNIHTVTLARERSETSGNVVGYEMLEMWDGNVMLSVNNPLQNKFAALQLSADDSEASLSVNASSTWISGAVTAYGDIRLGTNNRALIGTNTDGANRRLIVLNASNNCVINYDSYVQGDGNTNIYGNDITLFTNGNVYSRKSITFNNNTGVRSYLSNGTTTASVMYVSSADNLLIGNTTSFDNLYLYTKSFTLRMSPPDSGSTLEGYFYPVADGTVACGTGSHRWYRLYATSATVQTSDEREKENIVPLGGNNAATYSLRGESSSIDIHSELFDRLIPVQYNYINGDGKTCYGLIAQQVVSVMEELGISEQELDLVHHETWADDETGESKDTYGIAYENLIALLIHEVQKLKQQIS